MRVVKLAALLLAAMASTNMVHAQGWTHYPGLSAQPPSPSMDRTSTSPIAVQPLAPGEVLLELSSLGIGQAVPDTAKLTISIRAEAATDVAAQAEHDSLVRRVRQAARAAGVSDADIEAQDGGSLAAILSSQLSPPSPAEPSPEAPERQVDVPVATPGSSNVPLVRVQLEPPRQPPFKFSSLDITLRRPDRVDALKASLRGVEGVTVGSPRFSVADDTAARRTARADALAKARIDADAYAASLNMRVVRIARITERAGFDFMSMVFGAMTNGGPDTLRERFEPSNGQVPVPVFVGVDFVLAPR